MSIARYAAAWMPGRSINDPPSILSAEPDGCNFFYGHLPGDCRQINVRYERPDPEAGDVERFGFWAAYADGIHVGRYDTKAIAEANAIAFLKDRPQEAAE